MTTTEGEPPVDTTNTDIGQVSSLAVLLDNARVAIMAARDAGLEVNSLAVNPVDFATVTEARRFEERVGLPPRILGVNIEPDSEVEIGSVRL